MKHRLFQHWLSSTDCRTYHAKHSIALENDTHIVFKHGSHISYVNRVSGSKTCRVYHVLFEKAQIDVNNLGFRNNFTKGDGYVKIYYGRNTTKQIAKLIEEEFGLTFSADYQSPEWYEPAPPEPSELMKQMSKINSFDSVQF